MGSCISKCSPKSHLQVQEDDQFLNHVQDKLVISTQPPKPITPIPSHHSNKISPFPSSPSNSTSSASSFSYCTTSTTNSNSTISSSSSTLSSSASSVSSSSKIDRSFSNEFLWSCYKDNPHITRINAIKEAQKPAAAATLKKHHHHQPSPINRVSGCTKTTPQKRVRSSTSPALKRQKSFRKEPEKPVVSRSLRPPSPSRRSNASEKNRGAIMANPPKTGSNLRPASPINNSSGLMIRPCLKSPARETQTRIHRISSKIDEVAVREALAHDHYMESVPEDIDNPLISLDCFIFL